jgi:hypothetical protein
MRRLPALRAAALAATAALPASASACVRVSTTPLGAAALPAVAADSVRVFATLAPPSYTEVAVLRATRVLRGGPAALRALRAEAGRLGANGLLLLNTRAAASGSAAVSGVVVGGPEAGGVVTGRTVGDVDDFARAVAIRFPVAGPPAGGGSGAPRP